ncbi:hypothetical protein L226DRAFT_611325 [Lentinus tigrinus ALCF2SS1-7]|uniref:uncharacterized protein n=1 Tax=Lentinus tigrinus ALCF2SS1-7 TaxID=1328758 RepID=UPI0011661DB3|nr:hypothetical protein L226DRAFT_611325 [Lentinus tigrinus ALCF2SS1-7]
MSKTAAPFLAVMLASRDMYSLGLEALLDRGVVLQNSDKLLSFCAFLASNNHARAPLFHSRLILEAFPLTPTTTTALCSTIRHATRLKALHIREADVCFESAPELMEALTAITHLHHLDIAARRPTDALLLLLSHLPSNLSSYTISFDRPPSLEGCDCPWELNPITVLQQSTTTLQCIRVHNVTLSDWADTTFPKAKHFEVSAVKLPLTRILAGTMPNLVTLAVDDTYGDSGELFDVHTASLRRADNMNADGPTKASCWSRLESVTGSIVDIFSLGLTCPVDRLVLHTNGRCDADRVMLGSLLKFTPGLVHLRLEATEEFFATDEEEMVDLMELNSMLWEQLVRFTLKELCNTLEQYSVLFESSDCKVQELDLDLSIPCFISDCDPARSTTEDLHVPIATDMAPHPHRCPIIEGLQDYNVNDGKAQEFFSRVPTLRRVQLRLRHHDELICHMDCNSRGNGDTRCRAAVVP